MDWVEIFNTFGIPIWATLIIFGVWLLVKYYFNRQAKRDDKRFEHDLKLKEEEFKIQFSKLHLDRAETIKDIYIELVALIRSTIRYIEFNEDTYDIDNEKNQLHNDVTQHNKIYSKLIFDNSIFFSDTINKNMRQIPAITTNAIIEFNKYRQSNIGYHNSAEYAQRVETIMKRLTDSMKPILDYLESEFRKLMGVEKQTNKS